MARTHNGYRPDFKCGVTEIINTFKAKRENGFFYEESLNDHWEVSYISEGTFTITEDDKVYELVPGNLIFKMPYEIHKSKVDKAPYCKYTTINFDADTELFRPLGNGVFELDAEQAIYFNEIHEMIKSNFDNSVFRIKRKKDNTVASEKMVFLHMELFMLSLLERPKADIPENHSVSAKNYKKIIDTMYENTRENLTVEKLAELCNMSVGNLKKTFARYSGGGVMNHFMKVKITEAMSLLKGDWSINEISYMMGFTNQNYFSTVFKRVTGMLPSEYRRKENKIIM